MRSAAWLVIILAIGACAGRQTEFSAVAVGPPADVVECAAEEVREDGFTVTEQGDAGLTAESGIDWVRVRVVTAEPDTWRVIAESSDSDAASAAAEEVVIECQDLT